MQNKTTLKVYVITQDTWANLKEKQKKFTILSKVNETVKIPKDVIEFKPKNLKKNARQTINKTTE